MESIKSPTDTEPYSVYRGLRRKLPTNKKKKSMRKGPELGHTRMELLLIRLKSQLTGL
jgi:hypothetical protein